MTGTSGETVVGVIVVGANVGAIVEGEFVIGEDVEGELVEPPHATHQKRIPLTPFLVRTSGETRHSYLCSFAAHDGEDSDDTPQRSLQLDMGNDTRLALETTHLKASR
eukprot:CAMPEP_0185256050 /NCGR_PEP_ID=MMETSP1359-20130426/5122_1 /TAXON_ID=552665 /ORGANISM="Bigelowiella longifila, Strain CCMP242" /LENGTH=107 /DNA_ID=CAMNT_0027840369 /DNA_START=959 /DNA_END=1282 /DNA_ORIENTATION=+